LKYNFVSDNLNHCILLKAVHKLIPDDRIGNLIMNFAKVAILDREGNNYAGSSKGIPQGCSVSPVLMNIYMHYFDVKLSAFISPYIHVHYLRYADDLLIGFGKPDNLLDNCIQDEMNTLINRTSEERTSFRSSKSRSCSSSR